MNSFKTSLFLIKLCFFSSIAGLLIAWIAEYIFSIQPCSLCLYQRYLLILIAVVAGSAAYICPTRLTRRMTLVTGMCFLSASALALYHVGLENKWIQESLLCGASVQASSIDALRQQLLTQNHVPCDQVSWRLWGLSFAEFNLGFSTLMTLLCFGSLLSFLNSKESDK